MKHRICAKDHIRQRWVLNPGINDSIVRVLNSVDVTYILEGYLWDEWQGKIPTSEEAGRSVKELL